MSLIGSMVSDMGPGPTGTSAGTCPHPEVITALQVAPSNTDTVFAPAFATYTVSVAASTATPLGRSSGVRFPTTIVGQGPWQRETSPEWHRLVSITETVSPPAFGPSTALPFVTYIVCVRGLTANSDGPRPTGADPTRARPKS